MGRPPVDSGGPPSALCLRMTVGHPYIRGMWQSSSVAAWSVACPGRPPVRSTVAATSHRRPVRAVCGPGQQLTSLRRTEPVQGHQDAGGGDPPARHPTRTRPDGRWTSRSTGRWCVPGAPPPSRIGQHPSTAATIRSATVTSPGTARSSRRCRGRPRLVRIVLVPAAEDPVHTHDSLLPPLHPTTTGAITNLSRPQHMRRVAEHTSKERTREVVRDAHAYRSVP